MNKMVETEITKNLNEELNMEIFRATASQRDPSSVRYYKVPLNRLLRPFQSIFEIDLLALI